MFLKLEEYIKESVLVKFSNCLFLRMNKALYKNYKQGLYDKELNKILKNIEKISSLKIDYPINFRPKFYIYVVPNDIDSELLNFPKELNYLRKGKIVPCFDNDGFNSAYGVNDNCLAINSKECISTTVGNIHELSHLVFNMFNNRVRCLQEGFAEALPLYTLNLENEYKEHKDIICNLKEDDIFTINELLDISKKGSYFDKNLLSNKGVSFSCFYVSCYLFVRGLLEIIADKYHLNRIEATKKFMNICYFIKNDGKEMFTELANELGIDSIMLFNSKKIQFNVIEKLKKE